MHFQKECNVLRALQEIFTDILQTDPGTPGRRIIDEERELATYLKGKPMET